MAIGRPGKRKMHCKDIPDHNFAIRRPGFARIFPDPADASIFPARKFDRVSSPLTFLHLAHQGAGEREKMRHKTRDRFAAFCEPSFGAAP
jgi:hypothetical protein